MFRVFLTSFIVSWSFLFVTSSAVTLASPLENNAQTEPAPTDDAPKDAGQTNDLPAERPSNDGPLTIEELEKDPEYQAEVKKRAEAFQAGRIELATALSEQQAIMVRYRNGQAKSKADQERYFDARQRVRDAIDDLYLKALALSSISASDESAQYLVTTIKHRVEHSIYDIETAEGAAKLIDGGGKLLFLFQAAARSAVVSGQFNLARKVYDAIAPDQLEDIDRRFIHQMDSMEEQYLAEQEIRQQEEEADDLPRVKLRTSEGDVVLELYINQAPSTVAHFIGLVEEGFYDGLDFYQVIDDLLILTGDPSGLGDGNCGEFLIDEHDRADARKALRGSLVMAKVPTSPKGADFFPNSASSQFAILMVPIVGIEKQQTVFGRVIDGMNNLAALRRVDPSKEKKKGEIVLPSDHIIEATVIRRPKTFPQPNYVKLGTRTTASRDAAKIERSGAAELTE